MCNWKRFVVNFCLDNGKVAIDKNIDIFAEYGVYPDSIAVSDPCTCFIARVGEIKSLIVVNGVEMDHFEGHDQIINGKKIRICPLSNSNSRIIRGIFDFTNPTTNKDYDVSMGLGDRLGLASQGHIRLIKVKSVFPVLAQQSVRELNLTNRTFEDVLSSAVWAVLQEGYRGGYGADGDHLKTAGEVQQALDCNYSMITLDCSEYINNGVECLSDELMKNQYIGEDEKERQFWEDKYLNKSFDLNGNMKIHISGIVLIKMVLMYRGVLGFVEEIYHNIIKPCGRKIDFEISIDETSDSTSPELHYMIACELKDRGVRLMSLAPKFYGEFQKGIDYKGDVKQFGRELKYHVAIAEYFDYKISVHSGSDKFSVFPVIGELTGQKLHIKTAGTNWLEALAVIAMVDPPLFLSIYKFALGKLDDAKEYYHIYTEGYMVPGVDDVAKNPLGNIRNNKAVRQTLHITYGYILCERDLDKKFVFREQIYTILNENEDLYYEALYKHINRHLLGLGIGV